MKYTTMQYIVAVLALIGWVTLMHYSDRIRNSKHWPLGLAGSLFLVVLMSPLIDVIFTKDVNQFLDDHIGEVIFAGIVAYLVTIAWFVLRPTYKLYKEINSDKKG